jgi:Domain of unknown function (DUF4383)
MAYGRPVAVAAGGLLVAAGVLGFVPGVTTHSSDIAFAGRGSHAELLGYFQVSVLLNLVHIATGLAVVVLARMDARAQSALTVCGIAYLLIWVLGPLTIGGWLPLNTADNWLHLVTGSALLGLGSLVGRGS